MNSVNDFTNTIILEATIEVLLNLGYNIIQLIVPNCISSYICKFQSALSFYFSEGKGVQN